MNFLLSDEKVISVETLKKRKDLYDEFITLPVDFLSKMRHFQPQIGCFNNCSFCSKFSTCRVECWNEEQLRNIVSAIKFASKSHTNGDILLAWDRKEHREGVIFPYLDNDIGSYPYLYEFIDLCYKELGVKTRISTVGYSRHNKELNKMHKKIAKSNLICALGGVRLSITQFGRVWEEKNGKSSLNDYIEDTANFLKIYKPYYDMFGSGRRRMCVELRFNPFVEIYPVYEFEYNGKKIVSSGNYLFVSVDKNIEFKPAHIADPYIHALKISENPISFKEYNLIKIPNDIQELKSMIDEKKMDFVRTADGYLFENKDGIYYSFNPSLTNSGNYGINIYPLKGERKKSGYIVTERFFLNALYEFKHRHGLNLKDNYYQATWDDVLEVINICHEIADFYKKNNKKDKQKYINNHIIPIIEVYYEILKKSGYNPEVFFDPNFTIDTGMICNMGRAIHMFRGITNYINEPLTPANERNYGRVCSLMKQENYAWKLSCGYKNSIVIEKLDLFNTASQKGQVSYRKILTIEDNENVLIKEEEKHLYVGEVK